MNTPDKTCIEALSLLINTGTLLVTTFGGLAAWHQIKKNTDANTATFWLELRKMFESHAETHIAFRTGGKWTGEKAPQDAKGWAEVEAYMGLFEHCERLMQKGLIDEDTFMDIYSYRIENIISSEAVLKHKLEAEKMYWRTFVALTERIQRYKDLHS